MICGYEYLPEYDPTGGGPGEYQDEFTDGFGNRIPCVKAIDTKVFECQEGYVMDENGNCVRDDQIYNLLTGKANCAYEKLLSTGVRSLYSMVTELFIEFGENNIGGKDLTFKMSSDLPNITACRTMYDGDGKYSILVNSNIADKLPSIQLATYLIHEIAHAFLGKYYHDNDATFSILYKKYINETGLQNYSHDIMKDHYINRMAKVLQNFDSSLFSSFDDYKILASEGVFELTDAQNTYLTNVKNIAKENDKSCEKK